MHTLLKVGGAPACNPRLPQGEDGEFLPYLGSLEVHMTDDEDDRSIFCLFYDPEDNTNYALHSPTFTAVKADTSPVAYPGDDENSIPLLEAEETLRKSFTDEDEPEWLQGDETPEGKNGEPLLFAGQISYEDLPSQEVFGADGEAYLFYDEEEDELAMLWQV